MRMNIYIAGSLRLEVMGMEVENAYMSDAATHGCKPATATKVRVADLTYRKSPTFFFLLTRLAR